MIQHGAEPLLTCSLTLEGTGGRPWRQADWVLLCGGAEHHAGARCVASVCFCTAENCWAQSSTVSPKRHALEMRVSRKLTLSTSLLSTRSVGTDPAESSHCSPQIAQSTSRWFSARGREASAGSDRGSLSHPREEREARSQRCHGYTLRTNA